MNKDHLSITITPSSVLYAALVILGIGLFFYLIDLFLIILTAIVISSSMEPAVLWFMRHRVIRPIAVTLVYLLIFGSLFMFVYFLMPPLIKDTASFVSTLPQYLDSLGIESITSNQLINSTITSTREVVNTTSSVTDKLLEFQRIFSSAGEGAFRFVSGIFGGVFSFLLIILLSFYFAVRETGIDDFLEVVTPVKHQKYVIGLWRRSQVKIGLWMQGQLLLSLIMGVLVYLWLSILGVPYALLLAIFAALFELVPFFGSFVAVTPSVAIAFSALGLTPALLVLGGYIVFNQIQANLIYPLVVKKVVGVPPVLVILALIAGAQLAGFLGVLLSVPIAAAIQELVSDVQKAKIAKAQEGVS
ncbi:hypothetical protein COU15_02925 [Candidatus Kaiserbacteria bacterium CG10_big_fil_rev_8_21_14_0_10_45_20]|uniref:AI-2E family transporter n=1 Tax=Candidatus Kaiserbacteria bacterium CG10_big_fil_rev_8_21_14_0_10_45_20 TaxID=1974607 RepID=A0A2H0UF43_9BACT|nr:MAG: hypothetical protein COU15_02925 [Candidatus Kaiserbacteria bacterium CG10_big_fil_rev_8_21_14_0_10_45_20]